MLKLCSIELATVLEEVESRDVEYFKLCTAVEV